MVQELQSQYLQWDCVGADETDSFIFFLSTKGILHHAESDWELIPGGLESNAVGPDPVKGNGS